MGFSIFEPPVCLLPGFIIKIRFNLCLTDKQIHLSFIIMKKIALFMLLAVTVVSSQAQETEKKKKKDWSKVNISNRPKDHLMFQVGSLSWSQKPDSITTKGFSRSMNFYFMFDFPFKTDPRFSVGMGVGFGSDNMMFDKSAGRDLNIIKSTGITFNKNTGKDSTIRYRSIKLQTAYLEAPVELRFMNNPADPGKSWKFAIGVKVGTMISAVDKTRYQVDANGNTAYTSKEKDKKNFNGLRLAASARIGYGNFALFGQYQVNDFIKEGRGPSQVHPLTIGLTVTGL